MIPTPSLIMLTLSPSSSAAIKRNQKRFGACSATNIFVNTFSICIRHAEQCYMF
jgi:hypothetical protein